MKEHILVTGGAGFIGSHLVDALLETGHTVRVFDNLEPQVHGGLRDAGVQSSIHYRTMHTFTYYRECYGAQSLPITEALTVRQVSLPLYLTIGDENLKTVVEAVKESL